MGEFIRVTGTTDVKPGHGIVAEVNGKTLAVLNVDGVFHAIDNTCIHGPWRVEREVGEKGAIRSSTFGVRSSEHLGPRTPTRPVSLARLGSSS